MHRGRPVARLMPEQGERRRKVDQVISEIKALQARTGTVSVEALLTARHEGHRF
jgi:antitoxin (DNA-binding transcriptional repressor) of toxin-antitoxin stability system